MAQTPPDEPALLVVLTPGGVAEPIVERALREARDAATGLDRPVSVEVLLVAGPDERSAAPDAADDVEDAIATFAATGEIRTTVDVLQVDAADPHARTSAVLERVGDRRFDRVVVGTVDEFSVERFRDRFGGSVVELGSGGGPQERRRLLHPGGTRRLVTIFGLTYLFYLGIGGFAGGFDLLTGAISAGVVATSLSRVALRDEPELRRTGRRLGRTALFLPVLLWEVAKANVVIAAIVLDPRLPIDPSMGTIETDTREGIERMVLANSITLTPGTLVVDVDETEFTVHALTAGARSDLVGGRLQRYVAWVFRDPRRADSTAESGGESR